MAFPVPLSQLTSLAGKAQFRTSSGFTIQTMNMSPSILSWGLLPMSLLSLASSILICLHNNQETPKSLPWLLGALFYIGGFIVVFVACMLGIIRRGEKTGFAVVDKVALGLAVISSVAFIIICLHLMNKTPLIRSPKSTTADASNSAIAAGAAIYIYHYAK